MKICYSDGISQSPGATNVTNGIYVTMPIIIKVAKGSDCAVSSDRGMDSFTISTGEECNVIAITNESNLETSGCQS